MSARKTCLSVIAFALLVFLGCATKQRPATPAPPEAPHSTPEATPTPSPAPTPGQAEQAQLPAQGTPPPEPAETPTPATTEKKPAKNKPRATAKKSPTPAPTMQASKSAPPKPRVSPEPEPGNGQISPAGSVIAPGEPSTEQLLQSTENNLNNLKRQLSSDEQTTVTQIRDFINQSRQATKDNDNSRAHNLAVKAHLMCDDLVNRK